MRSLGVLGPNFELAEACLRRPVFFRPSFSTLKLACLLYGSLLREIGTALLIRAPLGPPGEGLLVAALIAPYLVIGTWNRKILAAVATDTRLPSDSSHGFGRRDLAPDFPAISRRSAGRPLRCGAKYSSIARRMISETGAPLSSDRLASCRRWENVRKMELRFTGARFIVPPLYAYNHHVTHWSLWMSLEIFCGKGSSRRGEC